MAAGMPSVYQSIVLHDWHVPSLAQRVWSSLTCSIRVVERMNHIIVGNDIDLPPPTTDNISARVNYV